MKYTYGQFGPEHLKLIKEGVLLFNGQYYWECHEELEHHWLELRGDPARDVFWAVIQIAASLYHYCGNNLEGAQGMLGKAREKIYRAERSSVESDILFGLGWGEFKSIIDEIPRSPKLEDFARLDVFSFEVDLA